MKIKAPDFPRFCKGLGLPPPVEEYQFHPKRKWRIDYAWPDRRLAVEVEGGIYNRGRHVRPVGFLGDVEKYNALTMAGWALLRFTWKQMQNGEAIDLIQEFLEERQE